MSIAYNVPRTDGATKDDYNRQVYADGTPKQAGWLSDAELEAKFPPPPPVPPTLEEIIADYETRIQARLDDFARTIGYDGIMGACTYASSSVDMYRIEGQYCVDARDQTWAKAFELMNAFSPGSPVPSWEEFEAQLPPLAWPEGSRGYGL